MSTETRSKVFIVQESKHNLSYAMQYGDFHFVAKSDFPLWNKESANKQMDDMNKALVYYNPEDDYLLVIGDPINIGACFSILSRKFDTIRILKWDGQSKMYIPSNIVF